VRRGEYTIKNESKHNPTIANHGYIRASESRRGPSGATAPLSLQCALPLCLQPYHRARESPNAVKVNTQADAAQAQAPRPEAHMGIPRGRRTIAGAEASPRAAPVPSTAADRPTAAYTSVATTSAAVGSPKRGPTERQRRASSCGHYQGTERLRATCLQRCARLR
jgi:hypothetical protein